MNRSAALLLVLPLLTLTGCGASGPPDDDDGPPDPVAINIVESSASVEIGHMFQFHYSVSNTNNTACSWSVNDFAGGNATVGMIGTDGLYTAPANVPNPAQVTVKAVAAADSTKSDTATVTITAPPPFIISPSTATVPAGATQQFTTTADVSWSLEGASGNTASLGSIGTDGLFTAPLAPPLVGEVTIVATSKAATSIRSTAVAIITFSNASLQGHYAFSYRATDAGQMMFAGGCFTADGQGVISDGFMDMNSQARGSGTLDFVPFTGAYQVQPDGRASMSLQTATEAFPFRLALVSDAAARLIAFETGRSGAGDLERQDPSSFAAGLAGAYVFTYDGLGHVLGTGAPSGQPIAAAGRLTAQGGAFVDIVGDININGVWQPGGMGSSNPNGSLTPSGVVAGAGYIGLGGTSGAQKFRYYMLSADAAFLVSLDWSAMFPGFGVTGMLLRQENGPFGDASLAGDAAMSGHGYNGIPSPTPAPYVPPVPAYSVGTLIANGSGTFTGGLLDIKTGDAWNAAMAVSGTYGVDSNGRAGLTVQLTHLSIPSVAYMASNNTACTVGVASWNIGVARLFPQTGAKPFSPASLNGRYALALRGTLSAPGTDITGQVLLNGQGALAGVVDVNASGVLSESVPVSGTYTMEPTGRGLATITSPTSSWTVTLVLQDPGKAFLMGATFPARGSLARQF